MGRPQESQFLLYTGPDGQVSVEVFFADETVWLTQKRMAELFGVDRTVILKHLKNIFETQELEEKSNVQKMHVANSAKPVNFYNLDAIISVGYRVNSLQASDYPILENKGQISHVKAELKAAKEFEKFRPIQDRGFESDFDREVKRLV